MVDIEKLKEICGDEALSETPSRYITTSEYRHARRLIADLLAEIDDYKRSAEVKAKLGDEARAELRHDREQLQSLIDQTTPLEPVPGDPKWSRRIQLDEVIAERDQLRAVIGNPETVFLNMKRGTIAKPSLRCMIDLYGEVVNGDEAQLLEIAKLRAEVEALRKDAERYRWLKECEPEEIDIVIENPGDDLDSAIDAAMAAKEGE